jgi:CheY-like chemotaxis protein
VLLVVENDVTFAKVIIEVARESGFKTVLATRGAAALALARDRRPTAITLDLNLPEIDGRRVLEKLKRDLATRHVPVQVITTEEEDERAIRLGARRVLRKPLKTRAALEQTIAEVADYVKRRERSVLVVGADDAAAALVEKVLTADGVSLRRVGPGTELQSALDGERAPSLVVFAGPVASSLSLAEAVETRGLGRTPTIVYAAEPDAEQEAAIDRLIKRTSVRYARSLERLFDEAALLLHLPTSSMSDEQRAVLDRLYRSNEPLTGKKVLIVDDDIRNIFALTTMLESYGLSCVSAETGRAGIDLLAEAPDIDLVLTDIMMPEMDGYDTIRAIRALPQFRSLPIFAVTAKAMKGDREKCFEAGATDYLAKPVEPEQLLSMMRLWLLR